MRCLLATGLLLAALAAPAHAETTVLPGPPNTGASWGVSAMTRDEGGGIADPVRTIAMKARAQHIGNSTGGESTNVSLECAATAAPHALQTAIVDCFLRGRFTRREYRIGDADPLPGAADAALGTKLSILMEPWEICVRAEGTFADGIVLTTPLMCAAN